MLEDSLARNLINSGIMAAYLGQSRSWTKTTWPRQPGTTSECGSCQAARRSPFAAAQQTMMESKEKFTYNSTDTSSCRYKSADMAVRPTYNVGTIPPTYIGRICSWKPLSFFMTTKDVNCKERMQKNYALWIEAKKLPGQIFIFQKRKRFSGFLQLCAISIFLWGGLICIACLSPVIWVSQKHPIEFIKIRCTTYVTCCPAHLNKESLLLAWAVRNERSHHNQKFTGVSPGEN